MSCYLLPLDRVRMFFQNTKLLQSFEKNPSPRPSPTRGERAFHPSMISAIDLIRLSQFALKNGYFGAWMAGKPLILKVGLITLSKAGSIFSFQLLVSFVCIFPPVI